MIDVEHLSKSYGAGWAVEDLSFRVEKGHVVGFLGPNGAGKSTTLRMLTGFIAPTAGRIRIDGLDIQEHPVKAKARIGYMPEACPIYPEMRVAEYLRYRAELKGVPRARLGANLAKAIELADVGAFREKLIGQLSKGMRQRVGIADALIADPPLLVLDEPTAGLDPNQIRQVRDVIKSLAGEKTVLLSTHILPEVEASCSRVIIIHRGKLVQSGSPSELQHLGGRQSAFTLETRAAEDAIGAVLRSIPGVSSAILRDRVDGVARWEVRGTADELGEAIFTAVAAQGLTLRSFSQLTEVSLEDVFSSLTTSESTEAA